MNSVSGLTADSGNRSPEAAAVDPALVRAQLERLLDSRHLRSSKRCQSMLRYVVEAALDGRLDRVKERTIGVEVFGRHPDYDTNQDSVVRNAAIEVRKRLAQYYLEAGHAGELRIVLPPGGYAPEFQSPAAAPPADLARAADGRRRRQVAFAAAMALAAAALWWVVRPGQSDLDLFWAPVVNNREAVLVCVGQPSRLYGFTGPRQAELDEKLGTGPAGVAQPPEVLERTSVTLREVKPVGSRYLFFGDTLCMLQVCSLLQARNAPYYIRGEAATRYQDLRGNPVVLIGGFNNRWTQRLTGNLRYYFVRLPEQKRDELRDRQSPNKAPWVIPGEPRSEDLFEDYAIVSRVVDASTERTVVAIAAVTHSGTQSAGDFLTHRDYIRGAFRGAPSGWHRRNIQLVLRTRIVTGAAGPPQVVATHFW